MDFARPDIVHSLLALLPILTVLILMAGLRWGGAKAGPAAWIVTVLAAWLAFGAGPQVFLYSQLKALLQSLTVLYIIWAGLLLYNIAAEAGAIRAIGLGFARLTADPAMQMIILAWAFSAVMEGASGFGVPVAVAAPLLIGAGIAPVVAVIGSLVGHAWAVALGNVGTSFQALISATRLEGEALAPWTALLAGVACLGCGICVVHVWGGVRAVARSWMAVLIVGGAMAVAQYLLAMAGLWALASFGAGLVGLGVAVLLARWQGRGRALSPALAKARRAAPGKEPLPLRWAAVPYALLVAFVLAASLIPPLKTVLNQAILRAGIPETTTALGWVQPAETVRSISVFGHPGALLAYAALISLILFAWQGRYERAALRAIARRTWDGGIMATIGIVSMVGLAALMEQTGMSDLLAAGLSRTVGGAFPAFSVLIGALGAFVTGSSTSSNFLFGALQLSTAQLLGLEALVILAAQTNGGGVGSMVAPAKVIVGCGTAGLAGQEGPVFRRTLGYAAFVLALVGIVAWITA